MTLSRLSVRCLSWPHSWLLSSAVLTSPAIGYLIANAAGSAILTVTAVVSLEFGFILLEGVWALVSTYSIVRKMAGRSPAAPH